MSANTAALDRVRLGLARTCRARVDYDSGASNRGDYGAVRAVGLVLVAEARLAFREQRPDDRIQSCLDLVELGEKGARGGLLIHLLVGTAVQSFGVSHLVEQRGVLSAGQCRRVISALESVLRDSERLAAFEKRDRLWAEQRFSWTERLTYVVTSLFGSNPVVPDVRTEHKMASTKLVLLVSDLAVRAYRLDTGAYPKRLEELVPDYLESVPLDPFSGTALEYVRHGDSYRLYGVGPDGIGDPVRGVRDSAVAAGDDVFFEE